MAPFLDLHTKGLAGSEAVYKAGSMQYLHTMIRVSDVDKTLRFFCDGLGLQELRRHESEKGRFTLIFLCAPKDRALADDRQGPMLELTYNWPSEDGSVETYDGGRNFGHLAFRVEDIYATCAHLSTMGVTINRPPRDGHMAFVRSPDGISVELLQRGDSLPTQEPWVSMDNTGSW